MGADGQKDGQMETRRCAGPGQEERAKVFGRRERQIDGQTGRAGIWPAWVNACTDKWTGARMADREYHETWRNGVDGGRAEGARGQGSAQARTDTGRGKGWSPDASALWGGGVRTPGSSGF